MTTEAEGPAETETVLVQAMDRLASALDRATVRLDTERVERQAAIKKERRARQIGVALIVAALLAVAGRGVQYAASVESQKHHDCMQSNTSRAAIRLAFDDVWSHVERNTSPSLQARVVVLHRQIDSDLAKELPERKC